MADGTLFDVRPFIGGLFRDGDVEQIVDNKYSGDPTTRVSCVSRSQVNEAIGAVARAQREVAWDPPDRYRVLARASELLLEQSDDVAATIVEDSGFTLNDARNEVRRAAQTLLVSAEEAKRLVGEVVPLNGAPGQNGRIGFTMYFPVGVVCAITPFNSPLNTVCHKVAPALAAGNGVVLKPASQTPRTADRLLKLLLEAGLPAGLISVVYGSGSTVGEWLAEDPRPAFYAFTGSTEVGERLHRSVGLRRTQLELGSLSSTIVCADAEIGRCAPLIVNAAFRKAGQVCTSVQRLYVDRAVVDDVATALIEAVGERRAGDPTQADTFVGPLISPGEADRVMSWIDRAVEGGARLLLGGGRTEQVVAPTVLIDVPETSDVMCREIFGPVVVVQPFDDFEKAIDQINDTPYGLSAGIFTNDMTRALTAARCLRMGAVHINETSSSRVDLMPYTGVKASGLGKEGPRYAVREMSEERLITMGRP